MKGLYSFSGIDSSGKSTQISLFREKLEQDGSRVKVLWSRGGYTPGMEFAKRLVRKVFKKGLPAEGHSSARDEMLGKNSVSSLWYILSILDFCFFHAAYIRFLLLLGYTVILDRTLCDTDVDMRMYHQRAHDRFSHLWRLTNSLAPKPTKAFYFFVDAQTSLSRSIEKGELYAENLETRELRLKKYSEVFAETNKRNLIMFDSTTNSPAEIFCEILQA